MTDEESQENRQMRGRGRLQRPSRRSHPRDEMSVVAGLMGITAVATATLVVSLVGALISLVVALLY